MSYVTVGDKAKAEVVDYVKEIVALGFNIIATTGTSKYLEKHGIKTTCMDITKLDQIQSLMKKGDISMLINIPTLGKDVTRNGFKLRSLSEHLNIPNFTCLDTVGIYAKAMSTYRNSKEITYDTINSYRANK